MSRLQGPPSCAQIISRHSLPLLSSRCTGGSVRFCFSWSRILDDVLALLEPSQRGCASLWLLRWPAPEEKGRRASWRSTRGSWSPTMWHELLLLSKRQPDLQFSNRLVCLRPILVAWWRWIVAHRGKLGTAWRLTTPWLSDLMSGWQSCDVTQPTSRLTLRFLFPLTLSTRNRLSNFSLSLGLLVCQSMKFGS